jgi:hypothetical protein
MAEGTKSTSKWANDLRVKRQPVTRPTRLCEKPGCENAGDHRAPKSRTALNEYYWFCLEHVREYNLSWDYFRGMSPGEVDAYQREALTGLRPTWKLGERSSGPNPKLNFYFRGAYVDPSLVFNDGPNAGTAADAADKRNGNPSTATRRSRSSPASPQPPRHGVTGYHGTGKSTHIEQVAARLNWPCVRVNLDSHVSRIDLVGKDAIVLKDGKQVTEFRDGILPWAYQHNVALVFDEYDAGRPDVMFVIQRVLESSGRLTLLDQSRVIRPHPAFRLFATANTVGLGDTTGLYHGTQQINQAQMDRWSIVTTLNYLPHDNEVEIVLAKAKHYRNDKGRDRQQDGARRRPDAQRLHQWRPVDRDEPAHGHHLGRERRDLRRHRLRLPR